MRSQTDPSRFAAATVLVVLALGVGSSRAESPAPRSGGAWLGVWLEDAVDGGVEVVAVVPGGPAELARLRPGDIILRANRKQIPVQAALRTVLVQMKPGDPLDLQLLRAGHALDARVKLVARAPEAGPPRAAPRAPTAPRPPTLPWRVVSHGELRGVGLQVADVTPALRTFYGAPEDAGVLVTRAEPGKLATKAGIRVGDILVRLGDRKLGSEGHVQSSLEHWNPSQPLSAIIVRDGQSKTVTLVASTGAASEVTDPSEQHKRERQVLMRRLQQELVRLERRIAEIQQELEGLRQEPREP